MPTVRIHANYQVNRGDVELATGYTEHAFVSSEGGVVRPRKDLLKMSANYSAAKFIPDKFVL